MPAEPPGSSLPSWRHRVSAERSGRRHHSGFARAHVTMGAIHMAGMVTGLLAADHMKSPSARWSAIAGFGIATGIGEAIWRDRIERERNNTPERDDRD